AALTWIPTPKTRSEGDEREGKAWLSRGRLAPLLRGGRRLRRGAAGVQGRQGQGDQDRAVPQPPGRARGADPGGRPGRQGGPARRAGAGEGEAILRRDHLGRGEARGARRGGRPAQGEGEVEEGRQGQEARQEGGGRRREGGAPGKAPASAGRRAPRR